MPWNDCASAGSSSESPTAKGTRLWGEPPRTVARTYRRDQASSSASGVSGALVLRQIILPQGLSATAMTMVTNTTAKTGGTHGWYCVLDSTLTTVAVTADYTDAATTWGTIYTAYKLPFLMPLTARYTGVYYAGAMIAATVMPNFGCCTAVNLGLATAPPILQGNTGAGLTTPPATGTVFGAITPFSPGGLYITLQSS